MFRTTAAQAVKSVKTVQLKSVCACFARTPLARHASSSAVAWAPAPSTSSGTRRPLKRDTAIKDEQIPYQQVVLVDPETSGLMAPASLRSILAALDRTRFSILLVDGQHDPPICKILDKKQQYEQQRAKDKAKKQAANAPGATGSGQAKEVQLTWSTTLHDLGHKLNKAKDMLAKGSRVTVIIKDKKGAERPTQQAKTQLFANVEQTLQDHGQLKKRPEYKGGQCMMEFGPK
ncbi:hypothetical protein OIV83_004367 [Microbotryomycetes sp. JL201]|nr:hypothetical protein OIV83_004367 [Microbotryomycetes sp. JL201]